MTTEPVFYTPVHGTWHRRAPWTLKTSDLSRYLATLGLIQLTPDKPFSWSGQINGYQFWRRWGWGSKDGDCVDWEVGGESLGYKLDPFPYLHRGMLLHSHGLWPAICAMAQGLQVPWIISIGSPRRMDMEEKIQQALPNLGAWLHIYDKKCDRWGLRGGIGDGDISLERSQRFAGVHNTRGEMRFYTALYPRRGGNDAVDQHRIDHSQVLTNPNHFPLWLDRRWADFALSAMPIIGA